MTFSPFLAPSGILAPEVASLKGGRSREPLREFDAASIAAPSRGNAHHVAVIATGLDPVVDHTLRIEPVFDAEQEQELRLESICVAGSDALVLPR